MKVLILGGTGFFGKLLADYWPEAVIASRRKPTTLHKYIEFDRTQSGDLAKLANYSWDIIYDQICYSGSDAQLACEAFSGACGHYIMTSTIGVYGPVCVNANENSFVAEGYSAVNDRGYAEGKRNAEAILSQSGIKNSRIRFPIVLGNNDPTGRFDNFIQQAKAGVAPVRENQLSVISSDCAARALYQIGFESHQGVFNACSDEPLMTSQILGYLTEKIGGSIPEFGAEDPDAKSLFNRPGQWTMDNSKLKKSGIVLDATSDWIFNFIDITLSKTMTASNRST